jgi:hypothetical protein
MAKLVLLLPAAPLIRRGCAGATAERVAAPQLIPRAARAERPMIRCQKEAKCERDGSHLGRAEAAPHVQATGGVGERNLREPSSPLS